MEDKKGVTLSDWVFLAVSTVATYLLIQAEKGAMHTSGISDEHGSLSLMWTSVKVLRRVKNGAAAMETRIMGRIDAELEKGKGS